MTSISPISTASRRGRWRAAIAIQARAAIAATGTSAAIVSWPWICPAVTAMISSDSQGHGALTGSRVARIDRHRSRWLSGISGLRPILGGGRGGRFPPKFPPRKAHARAPKYP